MGYLVTGILSIAVLGYLLFVLVKPERF
ncbi:MAG TPA: potassium-transporting ATPase subunit F [Nitrolancea sp.]|nr:potassium-transporting ATPase subunit F [Nitrolancea sp.]